MNKIRNEMKISWLTVDRLQVFALLFPRFYAGIQRTPSVLKYNVGLNLLYLKIGEIGSVCNAARGSEFRGTVFVT